MRDRSQWHESLLSELNPVWPEALQASFKPGQMLDVELGLYLLRSVMPEQTAQDAWTLFGGYPYSEVFGIPTENSRSRIAHGRHYLWDRRRRREWIVALGHYLQVPEELRGYHLSAAEEIPRRTEPSRVSTTR